MIELLIQNQKSINWQPSYYEEILQNIRMICTTPIGTVPLDRSFGVDMSYVDNPQPIAQMKTRVSIIESIKRYEPRVKLLSVSFIPDVNAAYIGKLIPKLEVELVG